MGQVAEWLEQNADKASGQQRSQVDTAKIVATFGSGIAATVVATSLQVGPPISLDVAAAVLLAVAVALALAVFFVDRTVEVNPIPVLANAATQSEDETVRQLRLLALAAVDANREVLRQVRFALVANLLTSAAAGTVACIALLSGG